MKRAWVCRYLLCSGCWVVPVTGRRCRIRRFCDPAAGTETGQLTSATADGRIRGSGQPAGEDHQSRRRRSLQVRPSRSPRRSCPITGYRPSRPHSSCTAERWAACLQPLDQFGNEVSRCFGQIGFIPVVANSTIEVSRERSPARRPSPAARPTSPSAFNQRARSSRRSTSSPGLSLTTCDTAAITVTAGDLDGDPDRVLLVRVHARRLRSARSRVQRPRGRLASFKADAAGRLRRVGHAPRRQGLGQARSSSACR